MRQLQLEHPYSVVGDPTGDFAAYVLCAPLGDKKTYAVGGDSGGRRDTVGLNAQLRPPRYPVAHRRRILSDRFREPRIIRVSELFRHGSS